MRRKPIAAVRTLGLLLLSACAASGGDDTDTGGADVTAGAAGAAAGSPIATGNGYGFGVYSGKEGVLNAFYMHPTRFLRQNPEDPKAEGIEAPNLVKKLHWKANGIAKAAAYTGESHVITTSDAQVTQSFFMPFGVNRPVLVTSFQPKAGNPNACLEVVWGDGAAKLQTKSAGGKSVATVAFKDETDSVALVPLGEAQPKFDGCISGANTWALIGLEDVSKLDEAIADVVKWQGNVAGSELVQREVAEHDKWRVTMPAGLSDPEKKVWRQSETIMRMAQIRVPNDDKHHAHGLILASLPAGEWFIPWVRDMAYATVALTRMGHRTEAREALMAYLEAQPVGVVGALARNVPYQISTVRYFGDGSEEADFTENGARNVEFDSWGLALWAMTEYFDKYQDKDWLNATTYRGTVYENARDYIVQPLLGNLDPSGDGQIVAADTGCWEENDQDRQHFSFSTISAIHGLRGFAKLAEAAGDAAIAQKVTEQITSLEAGYRTAFVRDGRIHGVLEESKRNDTDGSSLEAINWTVETNAEVISKTIANMSVLSRASGGFRRVPGSTSYERHEFLFIDFSLARVHLKLGHEDKASELVNRIVQRSALDHNFIPEMYVSAPDQEFPGKIGDPTGAIPMVGYGAGIYTIYMLERAAGPH